MVRASKWLTVALLAVGVIAGCKKETATSAGGGTGASGGGSDIQIALIPKGSTHAYWKSVHAGADQATAELGIKPVIFRGPIKENDRGDQIQIVQQFATQPGISGIILAPLDKAGLADAVKTATDKSIPVIIIDSALTGTAGTDFTSFVATNNHLAGALGGEELAKELGGKGNVVLLKYGAGSASTEEREAGFLEAIAKHPDIKIISQDQYAGPTQGEAKTKALQMQDQLTQAQGVFCSNESATAGMLGALEEMGLVDKLKFVGFDTSPLLVEAMRAKKINALVSQDPRKMGYLAVKTAVAAIRKQPFETSIDTGAVVVTLANVDDPKVQLMLGK